MKNKTVTIGIPAHNEEQNIANLINSIYLQDELGYSIERIIVVCDGCTDNTVSIVKRYMKHDKRIELVGGKERRGKIARMNQIHSMNKSDVLVTFDADGILKNPEVITNLVKTFKNNVGLVGGFNEPAMPQTFVEKVAVVWVNVWDHVRLNLEDKDTVHNHMGVISALSGDFAKVARYPKNVAGSDTFLYYLAKKSGFRFKFAQDAVVIYRLPATNKDFFKQSTRFLLSKHIVAEYFGNRIYKDWEISWKSKLKALWAVFLREPIFLPIAVVYQIILRIAKDYFKENYKGGLYTMVSSTKRLKS